MWGMAKHSVPIGRLRANPKNPRRITTERLRLLAQAMGRFGDLSGITYNVRTQQLIGGHQRTQVARDRLRDVAITETYEPPTAVGTVRLGYLDVDGERFAYREVDWDEATADAAAIAANQAAGTFEVPLLQDMLGELDAVNFDLDLTMFDAAQREALLGGAPGVAEEREAALEPQLRVIIDCRDEVHQAELLTRLAAEGLMVKASGG